MLTLITQKLQVVYGHCTYWMTALLEMSISVLELDVRYDWQVMVPNLHHSYFLISHLCVLTCITWKLQVIYGLYGRSAYWTTAILSETFIVWFRVARDIQLESYGSRHASVVLWYKIVCLYCKPIHTLPFDAKLHVCMTTKLTYLMTAYYTTNNGFASNDSSFYKNKVGYMYM